jgi:hypothetical protein
MQKLTPYCLCLTSEAEERSLLRDQGIGLIEHLPCQFYAEYL